jgi:glutamyl-tRNA synthetase
MSLDWPLHRPARCIWATRIEDLDGPRVKRGADAALIDDLRWLGIDWDEGPMYQSTRSGAYATAVDRLMRQGDAYACICTRREVATAASAPHADDGAAVYPGTCRGRFASLAEARALAGNDPTREPAVRFRVPDEPLSFDDAFSGPQRWNDPPHQLGDFVIRKNDGTAAYQLAVVVDDAAAGVTDIIRGDDLLDSTPRQMLLYRALGLADQIPHYLHLPLVVGPDGRRLAKRHGDTRLATYRSGGAPAVNVLRLLARWCGVTATAHVTAARDLLQEFDLGNLPRSPITFDDVDAASLA